MKDKFWPQTRVTWIKDVNGENGEARERAMEAMAIRYRPIVLLLIRKQAPDLSLEDVEDVCQQFFHEEFFGAGISGLSLPERFDPAKGRLRTYLSQALKNFLASWFRDLRRQKRGGGISHVSVANAERLPAQDVSFDTAFDQSWALRQFSLAFAALDEKWLNNPEKARRYAVLKPYLMGEEDKERLKDLAATLNLPPATLRQELRSLRQDWRRHLRRVIAATVNRPEDVEDELRYLCEVLAR